MSEFVNLQVPFCFEKFVAAFKVTESNFSLEVIEGMQAQLVFFAKRFGANLATEWLWDCTIRMNSAFVRHPATSPIINHWTKSTLKRSKLVRFLLSLSNKIIWVVPSAMRLKLLDAVGSPATLVANEFLKVFLKMHLQP